MKLYRNFGALVALGALTALPACSSSLFGGGGSSSSQYSQSRSYTPPASYSSSSSSQMASNGNQVAVPATPDLVRKVQRQLKHDGDYRARIDGVWGPQTEAGLRNWQQAHNVNATGALDMETLQAMNISANGQNDQNASNGSSQPYDNNNQANNGQGSNSYNATNGSTQPNANNGSASDTNQANANGTNQNYNTAGTHQTGSSYSSNQPANNSQYPNGNNGANAGGANTAPSTGNGTGQH